MSALRCYYCGKFIGYRSSYCMQRLYDHDGPREDIYYHSDCKKLNEEKKCGASAEHN